MSQGERQAALSAELSEEQRARDLQYGRPTRELTAEEAELLANADGLYLQVRVWHA